MTDITDESLAPQRDTTRPQLWDWSGVAGIAIGLLSVAGGVILPGSALV